MNKNVDLTLGIKAIDKFESPMRKFNGLTEESLTVVSQFGKELNKIGGQKKSIKLLKDTENQLSATNQKREEAIKRAKGLARAISEAENPTKRQIAAQKSAERQIGRLTRKHKELKAEAAKRRKDLRAEGIATHNLADEQKRLGAAYEQTKKKAKAFQDIQKNVVEANQRFDAMSQRAANAALIAGEVRNAGHKLVDLVSDPTQSALGFEDVMVDVGKFVKGANIDVLGQQIRDRGGKSLLGSVGVAELVSAGGKLNLNAEQSMDFADISEQRAVALGLSVDEAAESVTKQKAGMNLSLKELRALGDAINYIGDNSYSTAPKVNNIVSRIGAVGKASGLADAEVAGLAAVIDAGAPNAEMAATSMKNILTALTGGERLSGEKIDVLDRLGFDPQDLAESMQNNAAKTIEEVLVAIKNEDAADRNGLINGLFGSESQAAVSNMVGNLDHYRTVMYKTVKSADMAGSIQKEYNTTMSKTSSKLKQQRNQWENLKIQLGEKLLPVLGAITETLSPVLTGMSAFIEKNPTLAKWTIIAAGGLGVAALAITPLVTALYALAAASAWSAKQTAAATAAQAASGILGTGGGKGKGMGRFAKGAGIVGAGLGLLSLGSIWTNDDETVSTGDKVQETSNTLAGLGGAWGGAKAGALAGAFLGPVGAAIGGVIGGGLGFAAGSGVSDWIGSKFFSDDEKEKPATKEEKIEQNIPGYASVDAASKGQVNAQQHILNDNSQVQITVQGSNDPEKTADLLMKKLSMEKRRKRQAYSSGGELYDVPGALPA